MAGAGLDGEGDERVGLGRGVGVEAIASRVAEGEPRFAIRVTVEPHLVGEDSALQIDRVKVAGIVMHHPDAVPGVALDGFHGIVGRSARIADLEGAGVGRVGADLGFVIGGAAAASGRRHIRQAHVAVESRAWPAHPKAQRAGVCVGHAQATQRVIDVAAGGAYREHLVRRVGGVRDGQAVGGSADPAVLAIDRARRQRVEVLHQGERGAARSREHREQRQPES